MGLSSEEQRHWRELARQLRQDRRLTAQWARFAALIRWRHETAVARSGAGVPVISWVPAACGSLLGVALIFGGAAGGGSDMIMAGAATLIATLILTGAILMALGIASARSQARERRHDR